MIWVKATERMPEVQPQSRTLVIREIIGGRKKVVWYGKSQRSLLRSFPYKYEWLDEDFETDFDLGYNSCKSDILTMINKCTPQMHPQ